MLSTVATREQAEALARALLERRLCACVQIERVESLYRWEGALQQEPECRLLFKTTAALAPALCAALREAHPYALPQILTLPVLEALPAYARWVAQETDGTAS